MLVVPLRCHLLKTTIKHKVNVECRVAPGSFVR
jgi:hypothetical protein